MGELDQQNEQVNSEGEQRELESIGELSVPSVDDLAPDAHVRKIANLIPEDGFVNGMRDQTSGGPIISIQDRLLALDAQSGGALSQRANEILKSQGITDSSGRQVQVDLNNFRVGRYGHRTSAMVEAAKQMASLEGYQFSPDGQARRDFITYLYLASGKDTLPQASQNQDETPTLPLDSFEYSSNSEANQILNQVHLEGVGLEYGAGFTSRNLTDLRPAVEALQEQLLELNRQSEGQLWSRAQELAATDGVEVKPEFSVDGLYGHQTEYLVRAVQEAKGLEQTGHASPGTLSAIFDNETQIESEGEETLTSSATEEIPPAEDPVIRPPAPIVEPVIRETVETHSFEPGEHPSVEFLSSTLADLGISARFPGGNDNVFFTEQTEVSSDGNYASLPVRFSNLVPAPSRGQNIDFGNLPLIKDLRGPGYWLGGNLQDPSSDGIRLTQGEAGIISRAFRSDRTFGGSEEASQSIITLGGPAGVYHDNSGTIHLVQIASRLVTGEDSRTSPSFAPENLFIRSASLPELMAGDSFDFSSLASSEVSGSLISETGTQRVLEVNFTDTGERWEITIPKLGQGTEGFSINDGERVGPVQGYFNPRSHHISRGFDGVTRFNSGFVPAPEN